MGVYRLAFVRRALRSTTDERAEPSRVIAYWPGRHTVDGTGEHRPSLALPGASRSESNDTLDNLGRQPALTPGLQRLAVGQRVQTIFESVTWAPAKTAAMAGPVTTASSAAPGH
jgi:hypothetical protein